jgi:uncharacterized protein (DUF1800 family)
MKVVSILLAALILIEPLAANGRTVNDTNDTQKITHVLNRLTYGARPGDIEKVRSLGVDKFIQAQLNPSSIVESSVVNAQLARSKDVRAVPSSKLLAMFQAERMQAKAAKRAKDARENAAAKTTLATNPTAIANADVPDVVKAFPDVADMQKSAQEVDDGSIAPVPARGKRRGAQVKNFGAQGKNPARAGMRDLRNMIETGVIETKLVRAIESPRQLNELLADFWFNHFNISIAKGTDRVLIGVYEEQALRPYLLGNFRDMLGATMHHPAMMFYLDNAQNSKADFQANNAKGKGKKSGINENYARELLELHTLGVDGGYTQADVMELARVLTGWGMPGRGQATGNNGYWATFDQRRHDFGDKVVLGQTIKGTGAQEIEQVLDLLAKHPSTAKHVSFKIAQFFVDDKPPEALVARLSDTYLKSNGNIKTVLSTLFDSPEFWDSKYQNAKFKSPLHYVVSACRATGLPAVQPKQLATFLRTQGQPLYGCQTPDGYKNTREAWLNPDGLLKRMDFAGRLTSFRQQPVEVQYAAVLSTVNGGNLSTRTRAAIDKAPPAQQIAALIGSPEFMQY